MIETEEVWGLLEDWTARCDISLKCKSNTACDIVTHSLELLKKEGEKGTKANRIVTHHA